MIYKERLKFYLGYDLYNKKFDLKKFNLDTDIEHLKKNPKFKKKGIIRKYESKLINLLNETNNQKKKFRFQAGDIFFKNDLLTLVKNRCENSNCSVILRCLNFDRHWSKYYARPKDISWKDKQNKVIWRGSSTGYNGTKKKGNRFTLVEKWGKSKEKDIDIGFSNICQGQKKYKSYKKNEVSVEEMLKYKYILSVEGNDKDSGLNWKLNSNSLVLMSKPRVTSWLMETKLIANYHYVLLKDDFSDLKEKLDWCKNNQTECKKIVTNANKFMSQFIDNKIEQNLEKDVINTYFKLTGQ